ncbi:HAD superfamily isoform 2 [Hibiscus syriacus]|uniref:HAD superfamily isoform 2 n=1 Tax=Hibiscus syriacus TaxID=106335 RepID=A0A6A3APG3_HIBSY|nr:HAD superfamily isoform 2 [Hibiscus syriacus]
MTGKRYESDCEVVVNFSIASASTVEMAFDGKVAWIFDIDETLWGSKIFVLTGRSEHQRQDTSKNLELAGHTGWEGLILRGASDRGIPATVYKSERRSVMSNGGYKIHGSSGDQWSDLLGFAVEKRSFKLPNPMYYIR